MQRAKDIFEYYNQGIEKIIQQFTSSRDILRKIEKEEQGKNEKIESIEGECQKNCNDLEEKKKAKRDEQEQVRTACEQEIAEAKKEKLLGDNKIKSEQEEQINTNQDKRKQYKERINKLEKELSDKESKKVRILSDDQIWQQTEQYRNSAEIYGSEQEKYIAEKEDKALKKQIDEKKLMVENEKSTLDSVVLEKTNEQFPMLDAIISDSAVQGKTTEEILSWAQQVPQAEEVLDELAQKYAAVAANSKKTEHNSKVEDVFYQQQRNWNLRFKLQSAGWWIFCFPRNLYRGKKINDMVLDIACLLLGFFLSFIIYARDTYALAIISAMTVIIGVVTGFPDLGGRKTSVSKTLFQIIKNTVKYGIMLLPYPLYIYGITRFTGLYLAWLVICPLLYFGYDIYYGLKKISPNYKKLYKQYYNEALMMYQNEAQNAAEILNLYDNCLQENYEKVMNEITAEEEELKQLIQTFDEMHKSLRNKFKEEVWQQLVGDYTKELREKQSRDRKHNEALDNEWQELLEKKRENENSMKAINDQDAKEKAQINLEELEKEINEKIQKSEGECEKKLRKLQADINGCDKEIAEKKNEANNQAQRLEEEFKKEKKKLWEDFEKEIEKPLKQLEKDGFKEICGFDYRETWAIMHAMATNTLCLPAKRTELRQKLVTLAKELKAQTEVTDSSEFVMPANLLTGFAPVDLEEIIQKKIQSVLEKCDEFKMLNKTEDNWDKFGNDMEYFHVKQLPADGIYKLKLQEVMKEQILFIYDFGNLNQETERREELRDFIIRTFAYGLLAYNSYDYNAFQCNVIVSEHKEDYDKFKGKDGLKNSFCIYSESREAKKLIDEMYSREESRKCQELIVTNINNKEFSHIQDAASSLAAFAGNQNKEQGGIYPYFFMDKNDMSDKNTVDHCKTFIESFGGRIIELKRNADGDSYEFDFVEKNDLLNGLVAS